MFSLDVVRWRKGRSEQEAMRLKNAEKNGTTPSRASQERQARHLYGKSIKEMHNAYVDRVNDWVKDAPAQEWGKDYAKDDYSKIYIDIVVWLKADFKRVIPYQTSRKEEGTGAWWCREEWIGNCCLLILHSSRSYSPRAIYKGGGKYVRRLDSLHDTVEMPREKYVQRIVNFEKARVKHKELHPPMAFLKNKPLSCAKYFVEDIICTDNNTRNEQEHRRNVKGRTSCTADCPPSPEKVNQVEEDEDSDDIDGSERRRRKSAVYDRLYWNAHGSRATVLGGTATPEPPTTAEYVSRPKWRDHSPEKWVGGRPFTSTILSSNTHTASHRSITGVPHSRALLLDDPFAPAGTTNSPTTPEIRAFEHSRRVKMAADATYKPIQRPDKKYFNSMWTESGTPTKLHVSFSEPSLNARTNTSSPKPNVGRELLQQIRQQRQSPSKKQQKS
ncbi:hypothetical protein P3T76_011392 [Phytophthora citrophthora]|uniref:Uncharacterized protein n=1 Tax=Phytophthora citrophthora TaxID=4793 RepID=A0AAD9G964_9STRA|nr:hypothetical protein P3T76_011392 [Phytophthora citrophthora]